MNRTTPATVEGITDTRALPLGQLAAEHREAAADSLRHILPPEEAAPLPVCAFASSI